MTMQAGVLKREVTLQLVPKVLLSQEPVKAKRVRAPKVVKRDPVAAVMAMVELRDHMRGRAGIGARQAAADRQERWQMTRTKLMAFVLFYLMAFLMIGFMWAGVQG
jgi:hypothetical protein